MGSGGQARRRPQARPPAPFVGGDRNSSVSPSPRATKFLGKILRRAVTCRELHQRRQMLGGLNRPPSLTRPTPRRPEPGQDTARRISTAAWPGVPTCRPGLVLPCGGKLTKRSPHTSTGCRRDRSDQLGVAASPHLRSRTTKPCGRICISNPFARHRLIG